MPRRPWRARERPVAREPLTFEDVFPSGREQPANGDEPAALAQGDTVESEPDEVRVAASGASAESKHGEDLPDWRDRFDSEEEMWRQFRHVDTLRGRQANELGELRRLIRVYERIDDLIAVSDLPSAQLLLAARRLAREGEALARVEEMVAFGERQLVQPQQEVAGAL